MPLFVGDLVKYNAVSGQRFGQIIRDNLDGTFQVILFDYAGNPDGPARLVTEGSGSNQALPVITAGTGASFRTVFDLDFSALPNQTFTDGSAITFAGKTGWEKTNTASEAVTMANTVGVGITCTPAQTSNLASPRTCPSFGAPVQLYYPQFNWLTDTLRLWGFIASDNPAANSDNAYVGFSKAGVTTDLILAGMRGFNNSAQGMRVRDEFAGGAAVDFVSAETLGTNNRILCCEGSPNYVRFYTGDTAPMNADGTFPPISTLKFSGAVNFTGGYGWAAASVPKSSTWNFIIGALRAGSTTSGYNAVFKRLKLEVMTA